MFKEQVWLATQLMALRVVVQQLLVQRAGQSADPAAWISRERKRLLALAEVRVPNCDWTISEALAGELQDALDEIMSAALRSVETESAAASPAS